MDFQQWLKRWLEQHPEKDPGSHDRSAYTAEVMRRIKELKSPSKAPAPAWPWWRPALVFAAAAGVVLLMVSQTGRAPQIAKETPAQPQPVQVASMPETGSARAAEPTPPPLPILLAQESGEDAAWLEETLQLLEALDEDLPDGSSESWSDEQWMDEIEVLDDELFNS